VLAGFGLAGAPVELLHPSSKRSWRCGDLVLVRASDPAETAFVSGVLEQLDVEGLRVARPVRSSDGRWVLSGWAAHRFVTGTVQDRFDDVLQLSVAVHAAVADLPRPRVLRARDDATVIADGLTWTAGDHRDLLGDDHGARLFGALADRRAPVELPDQLVHADLLRSVVFAGQAPPALVGLRPVWRPAPWAAAVVVLDAIAHRSASVDLAEQWAGRFPSWSQLLLRALLFRIAEALLDPGSGHPHRLVELLAAAESMAPVLPA
jgi:uncharacterized protein (TIGR02569 family)